MMKRLLLLLMLFAGTAAASSGVIVDGEVGRWENQYGRIEIYPVNVTNLGWQTQYANVTSKFAAVQQLDFAFRFDEAINGRIFLWKNISHPEKVWEYGDIPRNFTCENGTFGYDEEYTWCCRDPDCGGYVFNHTYEGIDADTETFYWTDYGAVGYHMDDNYYSDWKDVTQQFTHTERNEKHFYGISNVRFEPGETKHVKWQYGTKIEKTDNGWGSSGKWTLFVKRSSDTISEALSTGHYVEIDPWWDSNWGYRREISISHPSTPFLEYYPVMMSLDTYTLIQAGKMKADGSDLRIIDDGGNSIGWWNTNAFNVQGQPTEIWFKITNSNPAVGKTYYLYYGNPTATSTKAASEADVRGLKNEDVGMLWRMDEGTGTFVDCEGCSYEGATNSADNWNADCKIGNCIDFEKDQHDFVSVSGGNTWSPPDNGTFEAWIKPETIGTGDGQHFTLMSKMIDASWCTRYPFWMVIPNHVSGQDDFNAGFGCNGLSGYDSIDAGVWQHVAVTWGRIDASHYHVVIYVDGINVNEGDVQIPSYPTYAVNLGKSADNYFYFDGLMDEVAVFNKVKTQHEIKIDSFEYDVTVNLLPEDQLLPDGSPCSQDAECISGICDNSTYTDWTFDSTAQGWSAAGPRGEGWTSVGNPGGGMYGDSCPIIDPPADSICSHSGCSEWHINNVALPIDAKFLRFDTRAQIMPYDGGLVFKLKDQSDTWHVLYDQCKQGDNWVMGEVDINPYAGQTVTLRFEQYGSQCGFNGGSPLCNGEHRWVDNVKIIKGECISCGHGGMSDVDQSGNCESACNENGYVDLFCDERPPGYIGEGGVGGCPSGSTCICGPYNCYGYDMDSITGICTQNGYNWVPNPLVDSTDCIWPIACGDGVGDGCCGDDVGEGVTEVCGDNVNNDCDSGVDNNDPEGCILPSLSIDGGADGDIEWSASDFTGPLTINDQNTNPDIYIEVNDSLNACANEQCDVPIRFTTSTNGIVKINDLKLFVDNSSQMTKFTVSRPLRIEPHTQEAVDVREGENVTFNATISGGTMITAGGCGHPGCAPIPNDFWVWAIGFNWSDGVTIEPASQVSSPYLDPPDEDTYFAFDVNYTYSPDYNESGNRTLTLVASDGYSIVSRDWSLSVIDFNHNPQVLGPATIITSEDTPITVALEGNDSEDTELEWNVDYGTSLFVATIDSVTDELTVSPASNEHGSGEIMLMLTDSGGGVDQVTVPVAVNPMNDPPTINPVILDINSQENTPRTVDLRQYESDVEDNDTALTWSVSGVDTSLISALIDGDNLTVIPNAGAFGSDVITLTLTDSGGLTDSQDVTVTVENANDVPAVPALTDQEDTDSGTVTLNWISGTDSDGDTTYDEYQFHLDDVVSPATSPQSEENLTAGVYVWSARTCDEEFCSEWVLDMFTADPDGDGDGTPDRLDACPETYGVDCNGCPDSCTGCVVMSCIGDDVPTCVAGTCNELTCTGSDGCGTGPCTDEEYGIFPLTIPRTCAVTDSDGVCGPSECEPLCSYNSTCDPDDDDDGVLDVEDNCPNYPNPDQEDFEGDGIGDPCDSDDDDDGVHDLEDNCPLAFNPDQYNQDNDTLGNACDNCWLVVNPDQNDTDGSCEDSPYWPMPYENNPLCGDACIVGAPTVFAEGAKYISITPAPYPEPVALMVTAPDYNCTKYVNGSGLLINDPVSQLPEEWGTVHAHGQDVIPETLYGVQAVTASSQSEPASATTFMWGDPDNNSIISVFDIFCILDGIVGNFSKCSFYADDMEGGNYIPNGAINIFDLFVVLNAFGGTEYEGPYPCGEPVPYSEPEIDLQKLEEIGGQGLVDMVREEMGDELPEEDEDDIGGLEPIPLDQLPSML